MAACLRIPLTILLLSLAACEGTEQFGYGRPLVLPQEARLGETIAMAIDSNYVPVLGTLSTHDLDRDKTRIRVEEFVSGFGPGSAYATVQPLAVFHGAPTATAELLEVAPGAELTVVLLNLPETLPGFTPPGSVQLRLEADGVASEAMVNDLVITAAGGSPILFSDHPAFELPGDLEPRPTLRLRPRWDRAIGLGFDPAWQDIATVEFSLQFPTAAVTAPEAFAAGEARDGNALAGPETQPGRVKVVVVEPKGFTMDLSHCVGQIGSGSDDCRVGAGPLVDVSFDRIPGGPGFAPEDFTVRGLAVYDRDGVLLSPPMGSEDDATPYFERLTMNASPVSP